MSLTLVPALLSKWDSLTAANFAGGTRPPAFHDMAPQVTTGQLRPPYAVFGVERGEATFTFESDQFEVTAVTIRIFDTAENLDAAVAAARWNGGTVAQALGFDNGTLAGLTDGIQLWMHIDGPPTKHYDGLDKNNQTVYRAELRYSVEVHQS